MPIEREPSTAEIARGLEHMADHATRVAASIREFAVRLGLTQAVADFEQVRADKEAAILAAAARHYREIVAVESPPLAPA